MQQLSLFPEDVVATGHVYYATDGWRIKIGYSTRPPRRRGGELTARIVYAEPGSMQLERARQRYWSRYRIGRSEWFEASDELLLWLVARIVATGRWSGLATLVHVILARKAPRHLAGAA